MVIFGIIQPLLEDTNQEPLFAIPGKFIYFVSYPASPRSDPNYMYIDETNLVRRFDTSTFKLPDASQTLSP